MKSTPAFGLPRETIEALNGVFSKYQDIEQVVLYGSRAKGNQKLGSDIDLALIAPTLGLSDLLKIENEIDDLLLPYKVDLSLQHLIESKDLLDHIARVGLHFR